MKYLDLDGLKSFKENMTDYVDDGDAVSADITVELGTGGTLGGYKTGDTISAKTPIETVIKKLLAKQIPPTYSAPTLAIANNGGSAAGNYEYGTVVTPKVKATFTKNDGGDLTAISIKQGSTVVAEGASSPLTYTASESITLTSSVSFSASCSYAEGAVKNDNLGDPYPTGRISAGSKNSSNYTFTPYRQGYFWGVLDTDSSIALTSDIIRSGKKKNGGYSSGSITGIAASSVANRKRIFVACPATNKGVTKVVMPSAMNADCTADFVKQSSTIVVEGANSAAGIAYNVWVYEPASISDDQTFTVTLG